VGVAAGDDRHRALPPLADAGEGWLLLISSSRRRLDPVPGSEPTLPVWRLVRHADFEALAKPTVGRLAKDANIFHPELSPELQHAVTLAENLGDFPILGGNSAEILADYQATVDHLVADIDLARAHVHLLFYIIADDATAGRVFAALERAVERGIACRVLADSLGSRPEFQRMLPRLLSAGILAEETMRVGFFRRHTGRIDLRNHRKIAVIDGEIGYVGSQNLIDATSAAGLPTRSSTSVYAGRSSSSCRRFSPMTGTSR
jgi:cardiolipin synthase